VAASVILEEPGDDYVLNGHLIKIAREITDDDLSEMKYLLHGNYIQILKNIMREREREREVHNYSVISWSSVLLVEETGVPGDIHRPAVGHW